MKLSTRILLGFSIVLILSVIDTASNYLLSVKVDRNTEFLSKSQDIIRNSARLHKSIIDMQSSFRGYLLTQDTIFLDGYNNGLEEIPGLMAEQQDLVKSNTRQYSILDSIKILHNEWIGYADALIDARRNMNWLKTSRQIYDNLFNSQLRQQAGKKINDQIAVKFSRFDRIEYAVRNMHSDNLKNAIRSTHIYSLTFFILTIIIGVATTIYIVALISGRIKTMVRLAESISQGYFTRLNDNKNDELTSLSTSLNVMSDNLRKNINELKNRNAELDNFAYVVSHDLKAPIRGIHNVIKWIEEDLHGEISPQMKKYLRIIPERTKRMENLINGLLDYARVRKKNQWEQTDVGQLVREIVEDLVPPAIRADIQPLPTIFTDKLKLEQVFMNLVSNAAKFTPSNDGLITISYRDADSHYEFSVKDNGVGIDAEYHEKIFEMFQTLREKNEKESTGIGLAIVKRILDEQHCSIRVKSAAGKGAEFIFTWPKTNLNAI